MSLLQNTQIPDEIYPLLLRTVCIALSISLRSHSVSIVFHDKSPENLLSKYNL